MPSGSPDISHEHALLKPWKKRWPTVCNGDHVTFRIWVRMDLPHLARDSQEDLDISTSYDTTS